MVLPVQPMGYGNNNGGFGFGGDWAWILLLLVLNGGWGGFGMGGFGGAAMAMDGGFGLYPWLNNSQNINDGFRDQMLNSNVTSIRDGVQGLSTQLCQCCGDMRYDMSNGFNGVNNSIFGAQTAISQQLNSNELASLNRSFAEQMANAQGFNNINAGIADLRYTEATENCATRANSTQNSQNIINAITAGIQSIKDDLCADRLEAERRENQNLRTQLSMAQIAASTVEQTAQLRASQATTANQLVAELRSCPIPAQPVYGNQPIFTCPQTVATNNCGCGCSNNF
jgi:uncharacterized phage infection (PIP) family protein YhgE